MSTLSDIEKYLILLKTKQQYLQTHVSDLEQRHTTLALSIELTTIAIEQVSCTGLWNVPTICPTPYCVPPYVLPPKQIHYTHRYVSSKPYPHFEYEGLNVSAICVGAELRQIYKSHELVDALNVSAVAVGGELRQILKSITYSDAFNNPAQFEALNISVACLGGELRQVLRTADYGLNESSNVQYEGLNMSATCLGGELRKLLIQHDQPDEALNISAICLGGSLE